MAEHLRSELVLAAVEMAVWTRRPASGVIQHSDQGTQYTSLAFIQCCQQAGIVSAMGAASDCYDNAITEAFCATLECELLRRHTFRTKREARGAMFAYLTGFYNRQRRHAALGSQAPAQYEEQVPAHPAVAA